MKNSWLNFFILILFSACGNDYEEVTCYHIVKEDYTEKILVNGTIQAVNTTYLKAPDFWFAKILWVEEDGKYVQKGDTVCILEHSETNSYLSDLLKEAKTLEAELKRLEADNKVKLAMLEAEIENNNIQLSITSLDSIQKKFAPPLQKKLISLEQEKADIQKRKLEKKYTAQQTIGEAEIRGLKSRIKQFENYIDIIRESIDQLIITAPKEGFIIREEAPRISFWSSDGFGIYGGKIAEGSTTWSDMNIIQIPDLNEMQVLADLSENNYKKVQEGQKVMIRVDAKNNLLTSGIIKTKMLTGREQNRDSKVKMYEAIIKVDSCHNQLTPGMNAQCEIIINEFKDTLVIPVVAIFDGDENKYVFVKEGKKFRKTFVETGYKNNTYCVIKSGLLAEEDIALTRPPTKKILNKKIGTSGKEYEAADSLEKKVPVSDSTHLTSTTHDSVSK